MNSSYKEGSEAYNLLVQNRKRLWYTLFTTFQNVSAKSDDVGINELPLQARRKPNTSYANTKPLNITPNSTNDEDLSGDDLDAVSDSNNEEFDNVSETGSEDNAKFSDSEDENEVENEYMLQSQMKHILVYESDSDEFSDDLDETNGNEDAKDFIDEYLDEIRNSRIHSDNEDNDDASECSDDENLHENKDLCQLQRKRTFTESGLDNDSLEEKPLVKRLNCQLKNINVYINSNESDFETDSE